MFLLLRANSNFSRTKNAISSATIPQKLHGSGFVGRPITVQSLRDLSEFVSRLLFLRFASHAWQQFAKHGGGRLVTAPFGGCWT
jgi:hypothetical protein